MHDLLLITPYYSLFGDVDDERATLTCSAVHPHPLSCQEFLQVLGGRDLCRMCFILREVWGLKDRKHAGPHGPPRLCPHSITLVWAPYNTSMPGRRYAVFCGRLSPESGDDGAASAALRRALQLSCEVEAEGSGEVGAAAAPVETGSDASVGGGPVARGGRLPAGSFAVSELVPLQMMLNDKRFYGYFAGRTQVCGWSGHEVRTDPHWCRIDQSVDRG